MATGVVMEPGVPMTNWGGLVVGVRAASGAGCKPRSRSEASLPLALP